MTKLILLSVTDNNLSTQNCQENTENRGSPKKKKALSHVLERVAEKTDDTKQVAVADVLDAFEARSFSPVLLLASLLALSPLGAIPAVPTVLAATIFLVAIQLAVGRSTPWLPSVVKQRKVSSDSLEKSLDKITPYAEKIERFIKPRWGWFTRPPAPQLIGAVISVLALLIPPLELIPLAVYLPAAAIFTLSLSLAAKDGLLVVVGGLCALTATTLAFLSIVS